MAVKVFSESELNRAVTPRELGVLGGRGGG